MSASIVATLLLYTVLFDSLSETELVQLSPIWFLGLTLGASGLMRERAIKLLLAKRASDFADAMRQASSGLPPVAQAIGGLALLPARLLLPKDWMTSPLAVSLATATGWAVVLYAFLLGIFPSL